MAVLSGAMVGPMDGIYLLNKTRVMASCRLDGMVLKPEDSIHTIDWCFSQADPTCYVYNAYSNIGSDEKEGKVEEEEEKKDSSSEKSIYYFNNRDKYVDLYSFIHNN